MRIGDKCEKCLKNGGDFEGILKLTHACIHLASIELEMKLLTKILSQNGKTREL